MNDGQIETALKELEEMQITTTGAEGTIILSENFEEKLVILKRITELAEQLDAKAKALMQAEFDKHEGLSRFEGGKIRVSKVQKSVKKVTGDIEEMYQNPFAKKFLKVAIDAEAVNSYKKLMKELPEGFEEVPSTEYIEYREIK